MPTKTLKIMTTSVPPETYTLLESTAKKLSLRTGKRITVSKLIRDLVEKHLPLMVPNTEKVPVILEVPSKLKGDEDALRDWLNQKINVIVQALSCHDEVQEEDVQEEDGDE